MIEIPLSDANWDRVKHLFPESGSPVPRGPGRPRRSVRGILDAILWIEQTGDKWHRLPLTFPPPQTCYAKYLAWRRTGRLQVVVDILHSSTAAPTVMEDESAAKHLAR
jgi:transposase